MLANWIGRQLVPATCGKALRYSLNGRTVRGIDGALALILGTLVSGCGSGEAPPDQEKRLTQPAQSHTSADIGRESITAAYVVTVEVQVVDERGIPLDGVEGFAAPAEDYFADDDWMTRIVDEAPASGGILQGYGKVDQNGKLTVRMRDLFGYTISGQDQAVPDPECPEFYLLLRRRQVKLVHVVKAGQGEWTKGDRAAEWHLRLPRRVFP